MASYIHIATRIVLIAVCLLSLAACEQGTTGPAFRLEALLPPGSPFHGVHGLRFDARGALYATSVIGQSIFRVDPSTGAIERVVGPPEGMADDVAFAADGTMVWTAIEDGIVYAKAPNGPIRRLLENQRGVNAVSFSPDGTRLFVTLVFYGDALYELDITGARPPRLIAEGLGGLNAFQVGEDGMIYGPLLFSGRVVRIDPDSGEITTISMDFTSPGALKLDFRGSAFVLDGATLKRIELASGATTGALRLPYEADNLAIDAQGRVFVSMAAPNAIAQVDIDSGELSYLVPPSALNSPTGIAVHRDSDGDLIYLGDLFGGIRVIDGTTGSLVEAPEIELFQPAHVAVAGEHLIAVSQVFGTVQRLDRESFEVLETFTGFARPGDAVELPNGDLLIAETGMGRVLRVTGPEMMDRIPIAGDLAEPTALALAGDDAVYVAETGAGRVLRVDLGTETAEVLADNLAQPEGLLVMPDGAVVVAEVGARRLIRIDPAGAPAAVLAADLPIGLGNGPSLYRGVAAGASGLYFTSDIDNTVYRLTPSQP